MKHGQTKVWIQCNIPDGVSLKHSPTSNREARVKIPAMKISSFNIQFPNLLSKSMYRRRFTLRQHPSDNTSKKGKHMDSPRDN